MSAPIHLTQDASALAACTVADVQPDAQVVEHLVRISGSGNVCGPVRTALCADNDNLGVLEVLEQIQPGEVLVLGSLTPSQRHCFLGDNLALYAKLRGAVGIIVDGYVRDSEGLREIGLSVHARGAQVFARGTKTGPFDLNAPVVIGGVPFANGDYVVADDDLITRIPRGQVEPVLQAALAKHRSEEKMKELLRSGMSLHETREQIARAQA